MNTFKLTISILLFSILSFPQDSANDFQGNWFTKEWENTTINIFLAKDGFWYGKIIKSDTKENIGKLLLNKLKFNKTKNALVGKLKRPNNRMMVNATLTLQAEDKLTIVGRKLLITKTINFTKAN